MAVGSFIIQKIGGVEVVDFRLGEWFVESFVVGSFLFFYPAVLISLIFDAELNRFIYTYFGISLLIIIYYSVKIINSFKPESFEQMSKWIKSNELGVFSYAVICLLLGFTFINLLYPERGWDALHFYFTNGLYFYLSNDIPPDLNSFSFYPTHKPPVSALLISYNFYINPGFFGHLVPILYFIGLSFLIFRLAEELKLPYRYRLISIITLLLTPAVYMTILEFAYYQELPVAFYFSAGMIYYYIFCKTKRNYHIMISSLGFGLSILSKISGFSFLIILFLVFNIKFSANERVVRIIFLTLLGLFLIRKSLFDIYIGTAFIILITVILLGVQIIKQSRGEDHNIILGINSNLLGFILPVVTLVLIGGTWILHMIQIPEVLNSLIDFYGRTGGSSIQYSFPAKENPLEVYTENAQGVSFFVSILSLFVGSQFSLFLAIPKLLGIRKAYNEYPELNLWVGSFFILWLTFYSTVSIRYFSLIWIPLTLLTVVGFKEIVDFFDIKYFERPLLLLGAGINLLFYYPLIPLEFITDSFHDRIFNYHLSIIRLIMYLVTFTVISWIILRQVKKYERNNFGKLENSFLIKGLTIIIGLIIIIAPVSFQFVQLASVGFDVEEFRSEWAYDNRESVRELSDFIIALQIPLDTVTVVVNFPGLEYFIKRPVIDLLFAVEFLDDDQRSELGNDNITEVYGDLQSRNIRYIIELLDGHVYYSVYVSRFRTLYPFLQLENSTSTQLVYSNSEFGLWELI